MAFTRFHDDPDRIMKQLQESTDQGMYQLNQPGNGDRPHYIKDPSIILQKWGANLHKDKVGVESMDRARFRTVASVDFTVRSTRTCHSNFFK